MNDHADSRCGPAESAKTAAPESEPKSARYWRRVERDFITGIFILGPVVLTAYILYLLFRLLDGFLAPGLNFIIREWFGFSYFGSGPIPGLGFISLFVLILLTGFSARYVIGRWVIRRSQEALDRIPLVNRVYKTFNQIGKAVFSGRKDVFKRAALIPYPSRSVYSLGIITSESPGTIVRALPEDHVCVFIVSTPNPTTGFLVFVPRKDVIELDIPIEEALKLVISGGIVAPEAPELNHP